MNNKVQVSELDQQHYKIIRKNVSDFLKKCSNKFDSPGLLLDIAPQDHEGAVAYFKKAKVLTLDINPKAKADYIVDICKNNKDIIPDNHFHMVVCTEVLEHTIDPFEAVKEIYRFLKPGGYVFITTPFNFRIHGPLPDCWRFTEHGLKALLKEFKVIQIEGVETENRNLMPIQYTVIAQKER